MPKAYTSGSARRGHWYLLMIITVTALAGYFGPWVPHPAAGLVITGLDLGEYVKFLPDVMSGQIALRREGFYTPLMAGSLIASLFASRRALPPPVRGFWLVAAAPLALAMLPPAWSPSVLRLPEFRIQAIAIAACLAAIPVTALTRFLPDRPILAAVGVLAAPAAMWPALSFLQVRPAIEAVYNETLAPGWGFWASVIGWLALAALAIVMVFRPHRGR